MPALQHGAGRAAQVLAVPAHVLGRLERRFARRGAEFGYRHRTSVAFLAVTIAFGGALVHFNRYPQLREQAERERLAAQEQSVAPAGSAGGSQSLAGGAVAVGPTLGGSLTLYVQQQQDALAALAPGQPTVAVVSFAEYQDAESAAALLPQGARALIVQFRIPDPNAAEEELEVIDGDVVTSVQRVIDARVADYRAQELDLESLLAEDSGVDSPAFVADYQNSLETVRNIRNVLQVSGRVVFAVVVEAPAGELQALAERPEVRLVDPAPGEIDAAASAFFGLLPTDSLRATFGVAA